MKKNIKVNYIYNASYQVLLILLPIILTPYLARVLGAEGIGTYSFIESVASYFVLVAVLGTTLYGQREIAIHSGNKKELSITFWNTFLLRIITTVICLVLYCIFVYLFVENIILYLIMGVNIASVAFDITWFFQGMEEFAKIVWRNIFFKVINIAYIFIFVKDTEDLWIYIVGVVGFLLVSNMSLFAYLPKYIVKMPIRQLRPFNNLKEIILLFIPTLAIQVYAVLDKTMIGLMTTSALENGYYEQAIKISKITLTLVTSLGVVVAPRVALYYSENKKTEIRKIIYDSYQFVWFLGIPLCFGIIGVSDNMVPWFFGEGYDKVAILLKIVAFLILAIGISNVTGRQYLIPTMKQNILTKSVCIGAVINFIINILLIPRCYSIGAALASVIAECIVTIVQLFYVRKEFSCIKIIKLSGHYMLAGVVMLLLLFYMNRKLLPSILNTGIMCISGAVVYFVCLIVVHDEVLLDNMKKIRGKVNKIKGV